MEKISIIEVEAALKSLYFEVESSEGVDAYELIYKYITQQKEKQNDTTN